MLLYTDVVVDVLDVAKSDVTRVAGVDGSAVVVTVHKWSVIEPRLPDLDAFRVEPNDWMVSASFKRLWEENEYSGASFIPVTIVE